MPLKIQDAASQSFHSNRNRPIRVVVFGSGPVLERGVQRFITRLEEHRDIEFLGAFCQSGGQTFLEIVRDLWRRRGLLALPLLMAQIGEAVGRFLCDPRVELTLNRKMAELSHRIQFVPNIHHPDVLQTLRSLAPDLGLVYGSPILKPDLFEIPTLGTLGIHHGKAPEYRGKKTTFWAMYNGEKTAGVTIQKVNAGLDTGEIVKQGAVTIGHRSYRAVCKELETLGLELYVNAIIEVQQGTALYSPQVGRRRKLCRDPKFADLVRFAWRRFKSYFGQP